MERLGRCGLRLLPYRAVGVESGLLLAIRVDRAVIGGHSQRGLLVAVSPTPVSDGGGYQALIGQLEEWEADLYLPNDTADGFQVVRETVDATAQGLVDALIAHGVLPEGTAVENFATRSDGVETQEGDMVSYEVGDVSLSLDLSEEFLSALENAGTSGETMVLGSVVNTFLTAYHAVEMTLTCGGAAVETGHGVYDGPLPFFDLPCTQGE